MLASHTLHTPRYQCNHTSFFKKVQFVILPIRPSAVCFSESSFPLLLLVNVCKQLLSIIFHKRFLVVSQTSVISKITNQEFSQNHKTYITHVNEINERVCSMAALLYHISYQRHQLRNNYYNSVYTYKSVSVLSFRCCYMTSSVRSLGGKVRKQLSLHGSFAACSKYCFYYYY